MFTGIVTHVGVVRRARRHRGRPLELEVAAPGLAPELDGGDSVAVNGVCLTVTKASRKRFTVQVVEETRARTTIGALDRGRPVNLELPARLADRLGGHLVQGHIDCVAHALRSTDERGSRRVWWGAPRDALRYIAPKGSVALDGVSLTVVEAGPTSFEVAIIPHTLALTTLGAVAEGSRVNLETDVIAKYVERLTTSDRPAGKETTS